MRSSSASGPGASVLLAGIEEVLRVEDLLDGPVELHRAGAPLLLELAALPAEAVLSGDRAAERDGQVEQLLDGTIGTFDLVLVAGVDEEVRVDVPVARVTPADRLKTVSSADLDGAVDDLGEPVEWDGDVLRDLSAANRRRGERNSLAPAPQRGNVPGADGLRTSSASSPRASSISDASRAASSCDPSASATTRKPAPAGTPSGNERPAAAAPLRRGTRRRPLRARFRESGRSPHNPPPSPRRTRPPAGTTPGRAGGGARPP